MKKTITIIIASMLCVCMIAGCGGGSGTADTSAPSTSPDVIAPSDGGSSSNTESQTPGGDENLITIKVGATPAPHAAMLRLIENDLLEAGIKLEVQEFTDYIIPNTALDEGSLDANFFQHIEYLNHFNSENGTELVSLAEIHYEPMCVFGGKSNDLANVKDGAIISIPNDGTNEARALAILEAEGLIKLKEGAGLDATVTDIEENPKNLDIKEMEAAQLPIALPDVDFAVINGNYAISNNLTMDQALAVESAEAAPTFVNVLVVRAGDETRNELQVLANALRSEKVKQFLDKEYGGAVVAVFDADTPSDESTDDPNATHPSDDAGAEPSDQPTSPGEENPDEANTESPTESNE